MLKNALAAADWNKYLAIAICILAILIVILSLFVRLKKKKKAKSSVLSGRYSFQSYNIQNEPADAWRTEKPKENFTCVAGMDEIKDELMEMADFLLHPGKYKNFGAKIPKGVLFYGPPGTGKTLLARALANEIDASFIYASGSEFIEKFVGVGAGRIRALFERATKRIPCIIFIDEIDAIGITRNTDNNSERDQTLNQLLIELDGFRQYEGIVVIGATNRVDMLDKALLRPGRFDRQIYIGAPSAKSREKILGYHLKNKPVSPNVDLKKLANRTCGLSGAHLANIVNEAALLAIKKSKNKISEEELDEAIIKIFAGLRNKDLLLSEREKRIVAWHESAHALAEYLLSKTVPERVTLIPYGQVLGFTMTNVREENILLSENDMKDKIRMLLAGRRLRKWSFHKSPPARRTTCRTRTKSPRIW
jgi:cell division protease FtsH